VGSTVYLLLPAFADPISLIPLEEGAMATVTLTANNQRVLLGNYGRDQPCHAHIRAGSAMSGGTVRYQYPVVDNPSLANDAHFETLEGLSGLTAGKSRPILWPGKMYAQVVDAGGSPSVVIDYTPGAW
jgi:hypothetical protein